MYLHVSNIQNLSLEQVDEKGQEKLRIATIIFSFCLIMSQ